jgi:hypothetical protein
MRDYRYEGLAELAVQAREIKEDALRAWGRGEVEHSSVGSVLHFSVSDDVRFNLMPWAGILSALYYIPPLVVATLPEFICAVHDTYIEREKSFEEQVAELLDDTLDGGYDEELEEADLEERFAAGDPEVTEAIVLQSITRDHVVEFMAMPYTVGLGNKIRWDEPIYKVDEANENSILGPLAIVLRLSMSEAANASIGMTIGGGSPYPFDVEIGDPPDLRTQKALGYLTPVFPGAVAVGESEEPEDEG